MTAIEPNPQSHPSPKGYGGQAAIHSPQSSGEVVSVRRLAGAAN
jgi:hypothetical protein